MCKRSAPIVLVSASLVVLAACGSAPGPRETYQALASWAATVDLTAHAWLDGAVPRRYARETIETARTEVRDVVAGRFSRLPPDARTGVAKHAARVDDAARRLTDAVGRNDHAAAVGPASEIHDEARALAALARDGAAR